MTYYLKYYAYRYFNKRHSTLEKKVVSWVASFAVLGLGLPDSFKTDLRAEVFSGNFKLVFRRVAWLTQFRFLNKPLITDKFLDFSIGLTSESAKEMYRYVLERRSSFCDSFLYESTLAQLSSAVLESQIAPGECIDAHDLNLSQFDHYFLTHIANAEAFIVEKNNASRLNQKEATVANKPEIKEKFKSLSVNLMEKHGLQVLREVLSLRDKLAIEIFVISGTFLGLHRESGFLAHDYDIDLGVFEAQCNKRLLDELNQLDSFIDVSLDYPCFREVEAGVVRFRKTEVPALIKLHHNSGVQVDIFTHFEEGPVYWHGSSMHRWDNLKFELAEREFLGLSVLAPFEADRYLTENYGDWRTPVKKFNCSTGTPNIALSGSCKTRCYFLKREYFSL